MQVTHSLDIECSTKPHSSKFQIHPTLLAGFDSGILAGGAGTFGDGRRLITCRGTLELFANVLDTDRASSTVDGSGIAKIAINPGQKLSIRSLDTLDDHVTFGSFLAVSTSPVKLAKCVDSEAINGDCSRTIVLNDLVLCASSASACNGSVAIALQGESI